MVLWNSCAYSKRFDSILDKKLLGFLLIFEQSLMHIWYLHHQRQPQLFCCLNQIYSAASVSHLEKIVFNSRNFYRTVECHILRHQEIQSQKMSQKQDKKYVCIIKIDILLAIYSVPSQIGSKNDASNSAIWASIQPLHKVSCPICCSVRH